jgi:hypothetical protein
MFLEFLLKVLSQMYLLSYTVIFAGKKIYKYVSRTSERDVLLKSVIPVMPAYFVHDCPSGMFNFICIFIHTSATG